MTFAPDRPLVEPDDEPHPVSHPYPPPTFDYRRALDTLYDAIEDAKAKARQDTAA